MTTFTQEKQQTSTYDHDTYARAYIQAMLTGKKPHEMPEVGKWTYCCKLLSDTYDDAPDSIEVTLNSLIKSKKIPGLKELMSARRRHRRLIAGHAPISSPCLSMILLKWEMSVSGHSAAST